MQRLLKAVESLIPHIHENGMEGETVYECAVLELEAAFKEAVEHGVHPTGLWVCPDCNMMHGENRVTCVGCGKPRG